MLYRLLLLYRLHNRSLFSYDIYLQTIECVYVSNKHIRYIYCVSYVHLRTWMLCTTATTVSCCIIPGTILRTTPYCTLNFELHVVCCTPVPGPSLQHGPDSCGDSATVIPSQRRWTPKCRSIPRCEVYGWLVVWRCMTLILCTCTCSSVI